ncbi:hypothetical protein M0R72_05125 [Candidatus Pacearchaeota archaeon]|jgi:hypothetical protein|nr:hypothetical protein [Candidatus Pacearchaeota archaeon]
MVYSTRKNTKIYTDATINEAMRLEQVAEDMRRKPGSGEKVGITYESAGDKWVETENFIKAEGNYRNAEIYGYTHDKESADRVKDKINRIRFKRKYFLPNDPIDAPKKSKLEKKLWSIMSIITLLTSLFFVSSNLTGFAVSNFTTGDLQWAGLCFFVCGLVFAFLFLKKKYSSKHL